MSDFQREVGEWGIATFPNSTPESISAHLWDEMLELMVELKTYRKASGPAEYFSLVGIGEEMADVYLLMLHLAHRLGIGLDEAVREKFEKNKTRIWTTDSGRGYVKHTEDAK